MHMLQHTKHQNKVQTNYPHARSFKSTYSQVQDDVGVLGSRGPCLLKAISAIVAATRLSIPLLTIESIALVSATSVQQTGPGCVAGLSTAQALFAAR